VDLLGRYSNWAFCTKRVQSLESERTCRPETTPACRGSARRLTEDEVMDLVARYRAGASADDLAAQFKIHRKTVSAHLHNHGVTMRGQSLTEAQVSLAANCMDRGCRWLGSVIASVPTVAPSGWPFARRESRCGTRVGGRGGGSWSEPTPASPAEGFHRLSQCRAPAARSRSSGASSPLPRQHARAALPGRPDPGGAATAGARPVFRATDPSGPVPAPDSQRPA